MIMKKKNFWRFFLAYAICAGLSACGGGDDGDGGAQSPTDADNQLRASIEGIWKVATEYHKDMLYVFKSDGNTWTGPGGSYSTWSVKDGKLLMKKRSNDKVESYNVEIIGNNMYMSFYDISVKDGQVINASETETLVRVRDLTLPTLDKDYFVGRWEMKGAGVSFNTEFFADGTTATSTWDFNSLYLSINGSKYLILSATDNVFVASYYWPMRNSSTWTRK